MSLQAKEIPENEAIQFFTPDEGELVLIYGAIGNGKTYAATADVISDLERGQVVYTTWKIDWSGFDERESFWHVFFKTVFFQKRFYKFDRSNWRYLDVTKDDIWDVLAELNNCRIYFDDVIVQLFDSYEGTKFAKSKRQWAFTTRHYDRTIVLVTQRPSQVQIALRSQVNRFYKCVKVMSWPFIIFKKYEYQEMVDENVNDKVQPYSTQTYFANKKIFNAYRTKSLRLEGIKEIKPKYQAWDYGFSARILLFLSTLSPLKRRKSRQSVGDKLPITTKKNEERLNTVLVGGKKTLEERLDLPF